jgi:hypothetical protein
MNRYWEKHRYDDTGFWAFVIECVAMLALTLFVVGEVSAMVILALAGFGVV